MVRAEGFTWGVGLKELQIPRSVYYLQAVGINELVLFPKPSALRPVKTLKLWAQTYHTLRSRYIWYDYFSLPQSVENAWHSEGYPCVELETS